MSVYVIFYVIFIAGVSLAAAAALLCDIFFFISLRHRRLKPRESKHFRTLSGISALSSIISIASLACLMAIRVSEGVIPGENVLVGIMCLLIIAFTCAITLRNFHLPALKRHQHEYHHLSDSFAHHQDSLLSTSVVSAVSWIFIVTIVAADSRNLIVVTNSWNMVFAYIAIAFVVSSLAVFTKKRIS